MKAINKDILCSSFVKILAIRGRSIADRDRGEYPNLWKSKEKDIEIIISSDDNEAAISARSKAADSSYEEYKTEIVFSNRILTERMASFDNLTLYNHNHNLSFKLIILEQCVYVCYFLPETSVHNSSVIKYKSNTGAYEAFVHYYNAVKEMSTEQIK